MNERFYPSFVLAAMTASVVSPAWAQTIEPSDAIELDQIIVTGELIDRPLGETGTSAEILDDIALEERAGIDSVRDILEQTPNVSPLEGGMFAPTVRGVDGTGPAFAAFGYFGGTKPRLTWQIDGRPANYFELIDGDLGVWDLEQVEVLRGAQSSLTGRNSIAGSVVIKTKDPTYDFESAFQAVTGNLDQRQISAMVNAPILNDMLALRLTGDWDMSSSAVSFQSYPGADDPGEKEKLNVRAKILVEPDIGDETRLLVNLTHNKIKRPGSERVELPFANRNSFFPTQPVHNVTTNSIGAEFTTALTDTLSLDVNSTFANVELDRVATDRGGPADITTTEFTLEPKLRYENENGFAAVAGLYYFQSRQDEFLRFNGDYNFDDETDTFAVYAEGIVPFGDQFDLLVGARYEQEKRKRVGGGTGSFGNVNLDETYEAFMPKLGLTWHQTDSISWGAQVSRGYNAGGAGVPFTPPLQHYQFDPEYVWNFELYGRQEFADGRIRTTQNIFLADYTDMQILLDQNPNNSNSLDMIVQNFDRVRTYGAELGVSADITDQFMLFGNVGLLGTEIIDSPDAALEGNELQNSPNLTANAGVVWTKDSWRASATARYSAGNYSDIENRPRGKTNPYVVADADLSYNFGNVEVFGSIKNIFDSGETVAIFTNAASDQAIIQQPRSFNFGVKARF